MAQVTGIATERTTLLGRVTSVFRAVVAAVGNQRSSAVQRQTHVPGRIELLDDPMFQIEITDETA